MILFPPEVENIIPAFVDEIVIPFKLNPAIGFSDFNKIKVLVKDSYSNEQLTTIENNNISLLDNGIYQLKIDVSGDDSPFQSKKYYKFQIGLVPTEGDNIYYSSVMVGKKINEPQLSIEKSNDSQFIGTYSTDDPLEKVYYYCFNLYENNVLKQTSGKKVHNNLLDDLPNKTKDYWDIQINFDEDKEYKIEYQIETVNGYSKKSDKIDIKYIEAGFPNLGPYQLNADFNSEEGYNLIYLNPLILSNKKLSGNFFLYRADSNSNFLKWEKLIDFKLKEYPLTLTQKYLYKDYCIEQGVSYSYALQAYGKNPTNDTNDKDIFYSAKTKTAIKENTFEDCFLFDGERQLKIRFNPKINNLKSTILETKTDTIGGKYPFIFRNGNVNYKEFQISGLLSINSDENREFLIEDSNFTPEKRERTSSKQIDIKNNFNSFLTSEKFYEERKFKTKVLDWLTDGKPKLFKSAAEGNFIVRLLNVSLTPTDQLGRLLHTFNCTAYEIDEYSMENLKKYQFLDKSNLAKIIQISKTLTNEQQFIFPQLTTEATISSFPGTSFHYQLQNDSEDRHGTIDFDGLYVFDQNILKDNPLKCIKLFSGESVWPTNTKINYKYLNLEADLIETNIISIKKFFRTWLNKSGMGIFQGEDQKEINNLLFSISNGEQDELINYGIYGTISKKPMEVYSIDTPMNLNTIYFKMDDEGIKYFIPLTGEDLLEKNPEFSFINFNSIYSIQYLNDFNEFIEEDLSKSSKDFEIIQNFKSLYLGIGLQADLYLKEKIINRSSTQGGSDIIYAL